MFLKSFPRDLQYDKMDCGPSCLRMLSRYYGKFYSLQFLREKCGITREGVSLLDISHAAETIGFRTRSLKCTVNQLRDRVPLPCIVHWGNSHFVIVYKITKTKVFVSDPAKGLVTYTYKQFIKKWYKKGEKKGILMALEPQADFKEREVEEKTSRKKTISNFMGYFAPYKKSFINLFAVMFVVTLLQAMIPILSRAVIDVGIYTQDLDFIHIVVIAHAVILLSITLSNAVRDWIMQHLTSRLNIALISDYLTKLMNLPITFFENKMIGDILQRAQDHERIRNFIMNNSLNLIFSSFTFISFSIILLLYNRVVMFIFLGGSLLYFVWVFAFLRLRRRLDLNYFELMSRDQSYWVETIRGIQDIKVNNYEKAKRWKWENIQARIYKVNLRVLSVTNSQNQGAQFIDSLKNLFITFYCARAVIQGEMTFGIMISTQIIIGMLNGPVQQFVQFITSAQYARLSFSRLNEIHKLEDEEEQTVRNHIDLPENKNLIVNNVSFQYALRTPFVLKNIKIIIPEKKVTAIVGDSGSGKSTLLKLLLRLYKPTYGEIMIGNMNINNIGLKQWRNKCGVVLQDGRIFNDTILNNIVLDDEKIEYERLKQAVETANISQEIEKLPLGYQTKMGEQGRGLSGGQKQRLLIARALYKNPDYLFFDEATNSLDTINEQKIVQALEKAFKGKTVIVVAHRLSTIRKADQIIVMKEGRVVETGNHKTLMQKESYYAQLVKSQMEFIPQTTSTLS